MMNAKLEQLLTILAATLDSLRHEGYAWYVGDSTLDIHRTDDLNPVAYLETDSNGDAVVKEPVTETRNVVDLEEYRRG